MPGNQLDSGLYLIIVNTKGWGVLQNENIQKIHDQIGELLKTASSSPAGSIHVSQITNTASNPAAITTTSPSYAVTGDTDTDNNFTETKNKIDAIIADLGEIRTNLVDNNTLSNEIKDKVNSLRDSITKGSGVAVLKDTP